MAALIPIAPSDTFDQWRQKDNAAIGAINNIGTPPNLFTLIDPVNNGDVLVYNAAHADFRNAPISALVDSIVNGSPLLKRTGAKQFFMASQRTVF